MFVTVSFTVNLLLDYERVECRQNKRGLVCLLLHDMLAAAALEAIMFAHSTFQSSSQVSKKGYHRLYRNARLTLLFVLYRSGLWGTDRKKSVVESFSQTFDVQKAWKQTQTPSASMYGTIICGDEEDGWRGRDKQYLGVPYLSN